MSFLDSLIICLAQITLHSTKIHVRCPKTDTYKLYTGRNKMSEELRKTVQSNTPFVEFLYFVTLNLTS